MSTRSCAHGQISLAPAWNAALPVPAAPSGQQVNGFPALTVQAAQQDLAINAADEELKSTRLLDAWLQVLPPAQNR